MSLVIALVVLGPSEGLAGRPGELGDRHFKKSPRGAGILTDRLERRKIARQAQREKALEAANENSALSQDASSTQEKASGQAAQGRLVAEPPRKSPDRSSRGNATGTVREKRRGAGRGGKGTGPSKRRRVVLKPLFGD